MIEVVLVDDQELVRDGLAALLRVAPDIDVVGEASDGRQAVELVRRIRPHVVVMDVRMPVLNGLAATAEILQTSDPEAPDDHVDDRRPRILVLTTFDLDEYVYEALAAGASGFLLKDASTAELIHAVRVVAAGDALLAPSITRRLIADFARRRPTPVAGAQSIAALTPREREALLLIARGMSNAEIAAELVVAEETVKTHVGRILAKLNLRDRAQAVVVAFESGLVRGAS